MSILLIGDPHFKEKNKLDTDIAVDFIISKIKTEITNIKAVIVLGDVLHDHSKCYQNAHKRASDFLLALANLCETYVIMGNHDRPDNQDFLTDRHFFTGYNYVPHLHIVSKVEVIEILQRKIILVPYVAAGRFKEALYTYNDTKVWWKNCDIICAHQEFRNCILKEESNTISSIGDIWKDDDIQIYSGHIHLAHDYNNIHYVGSMTQNSYDESTYKRVILLNLQDLVSQDIILPVRKKILVELTEENFTQYVPNIENELTIRITCSISTNIKENLLIKQWQDSGIRVVIQYNKNITHENNLEQITVSEQSFRKYLEKRVKKNENFVYLLEQIFPTIKSN